MQIISNSLNCFFNVRQLTLLSNPLFSNFLNSRESDLNNSEELLNQFYYSNYYLLSNVTISPLNLSIYTKMNIVINDTSTKEYSTNEYSVSVLAFINQINTALFHILNDKNYRPLNTFMFFFLKNVQNGYPSLIQMKAIAKSKLFDSIKKSKEKNFTFILGIIPIKLLLFFLLGKVISKAIRRKADYLEVFFDIGGSTIKNAIEKCENFNVRMQNDNLNGEDEAEEDITREKSERKDTIDKDFQHKKHFVKENSGGKELKERLLIIEILALLLYSFFLLIFIFDRLAKDKIIKYVNTFEYFASAQNEYIKMLNNVREYVFGSAMYINITKYNNDLPKYLLGIHEEIAMRSKELKQDKFLIPNNIYGIYYSLYEKSICDINDKYS